MLEKHNSQARLCLRYLRVQAQPTVKLLRPFYADAARAGTAGAPAGPARSSKVLLACPDVQGKHEMTKSMGKLKGSTFKRFHVDIDLTPAQAALRRAIKQPDFQFSSDRAGSLAGGERSSFAAPLRSAKRPALAPALSAAAPTFENTTSASTPATASASAPAHAPRPATTSAPAAPSAALAASAAHAADAGCVHTQNAFAALSA